DREPPLALRADTSRKLDGLQACSVDTYGCRLHEVALRGRSRLVSDSSGLPSMVVRHSVPIVAHAELTGLEGKDYYLTNRPTMGADHATTRLRQAGGCNSRKRCSKTRMRRVASRLTRRAELRRSPAGSRV